MVDCQAHLISLLYNTRETRASFMLTLAPDLIFDSTTFFEFLLQVYSIFLLLPGKVLYSFTPNSGAGGGGAECKFLKILDS